MQQVERSEIAVMHLINEHVAIDEISAPQQMKKVLCKDENKCDTIDAKKKAHCSRRIKGDTA